MNTAPATAEAEECPDPSAQEILGIRSFLQALMEVGAGVGRVMQRETEEPEAAPANAAAPTGAPAAAPTPAPRDAAGAARAKDLAIAFEHLSRAMRRNILLTVKLGEPSAEARAGRQRTAARKRIIREVEDTIQRRTEDEEADRLEDELLDRLDSPELEDELGDRPVAEIIADICRDLGLAHLPGSHPWKRRTPADIAELCARAARRPGEAGPTADRPPRGAAAGGDPVVPAGPGPADAAGAAQRPGPERPPPERPPPERSGSRGGPPTDRFGCDDPPGEPGGGQGADAAGGRLPDPAAWRGRPLYPVGFRPGVLGGPGRIDSG